MRGQLIRILRTEVGIGGRFGLLLPPALLLHLLVPNRVVHYPEVKICQLSDRVEWSEQLKPCGLVHCFKPYYNRESTRGKTVDPLPKLKKLVVL